MNGDKGAFAVGVRLKEIGCPHAVYQDCRVLHSDLVGMVFEVERTVSEGGNVETVVSQVLLPWTSINYVLLVEERT
jgi:hypothetical protein